MNFAENYKIRGLIIPDEDKKYVSEHIKVNLFTYKNIDFRDRIPLKDTALIQSSEGFSAQLC